MMNGNNRNCTEIDQQPRPPGYFLHHTAACVLSRGPGKLVKKYCHYGADIASETILIQNLAHTEEFGIVGENWFEFKFQEIFQLAV